MTDAIPIFDGHNDTLKRLADAGPDAAAGFLHGDGALVPNAVGDAAGLQALPAAMLTRGYGEPLVRRICASNWLSALERSWAAC